jgi:hypothetical protein
MNEELRMKNCGAKPKVSHFKPHEQSSCTAPPQLFGNRRGAETKIALKLRRSAICTVLGEVGTDFRELGVGFLVTFLPIKKVTESVFNRLKNTN